MCIAIIMNYSRIGESRQWVMGTAFVVGFLIHQTLSIIRRGILSDVEREARRFTPVQKERSVFFSVNQGPTLFRIESIRLYR